LVAANLTTLDNILKELYLPPVVEQLNNEILYLKRLETREATDMQGRQANIAVHNARSGGVGARGDAEALPTAGNQGYAVATYDLKYLYGRIQVTGPAMAKTKSDAGAFLRALSSEMDGIRTDLRKDLARQVWGTGDGKIVACGVTSAAAEVVIGSREPIDKGQLYVGAVVDIGTTADSNSLVSAEAITAVDPSVPSITVTTAITTTSANVVSRAGSYGKEINGLQNIVPTAAGSLGGIDGSSNAYWDNLRANASGAIALADLLDAFGAVRMFGGQPSVILTTFGVQNAIFSLHQGQVRYNEPKNIQGGYSVLDFFGLPVVADPEAKWGELRVLDERFLKVFSNRDWHFLDEDGHVLKWVTGYDAWEAVLARYMQLGATRRNVQFVLYGLTDDALGYT
jgi:hypothetical protein